MLHCWSLSLEGETVKSMSHPHPPVTFPSSKGTRGQGNEKGRTLRWTQSGQRPHWTHGPVDTRDDGQGMETKWHTVCCPHRSDTISTQSRFPHYATRGHKYKEKIHRFENGLFFFFFFLYFSLSGRVLFFVLLNWEGEEDDGKTEVQTTRAWEGGWKVWWAW